LVCRSRELFSLMAHREGDACKTLEELKRRAQQTYVQPLWLAVIPVAWEKMTRHSTGCRRLSTTGRRYWFTSRWIRPSTRSVPTPGLPGCCTASGSKGTPVLPLAFLELVCFLRMQSGAGWVSLL